MHVPKGTMRYGTGWLNTFFELLPGDKSFRKAILLLGIKREEWRGGKKNPIPKAGCTNNGAVHVRPPSPSLSLGQHGGFQFHRRQENSAVSISLHPETRQLSPARPLKN